MTMNRHPNRRRTRQVLSLGLAGAILALGFGTSQALAAPKPSPTPTPSASVAVLPKLPTAPKVRNGFFANITHAPALVAQQLRLFEQNINREGTQVGYVLVKIFR